MKICYFVASVGLGRGDVFVPLANAMSDEHEVVILAPKGAKFRDRLKHEVELVEYQSRNSRLNPFLHLELYGLLKNINPDIVHTHFAKATEVFSLLNRALVVPWVATKHNPRKGHIYNKVDHVIAVSEGVAETIGHKRVCVIYNGLQPHELVSCEKAPVFTVLAVGRLEKVKAFDRLIEECAKLSFDFKLKIVGDGTQKERLLGLTRQLNMQEKVAFLGYRTDIPELMQGSDVVVVCSHSEGFSLVILEALYYGKALVSRKVGIAEEILSEKFLIEDFDICGKLKQVYEHYDVFAQGFKELKEQKASDYLLKNSVKQHLEYYKEILSC